MVEIYRHEPAQITDMLEEKYRKRSFLRFSPAIDVPRLEKEYRSIPEDVWASSYWGDVHCSVGMLLLRGGKEGGEGDFTCDEVFDREILEKLPYISSLISAYGPFGKATYAFIFRMLPRGVTLVHRDLHEAWAEKFRIHIPITTNRDAVLISDKKMIHFAKGYAWSFDNYSLHGVVNGATERTHLIFDVPLNDKLAEQLDCAEYAEGWEDEEKLAIISDKKARAIAPYPGDATMLETLKLLKSYGWSPGKIAVYLQ